MIGDDRAESREVGDGVSYLAAASSLVIIGLALLQLLSSQIAAPYTGIESGLAARVIAIQWAALGSMLAIGGLLRIRALVLFASDVLSIVGASGAVVMMLGQPEMVPLAVHGAIAIVGLLTGGLARMTGKADPESEIEPVRQDASRSAAMPTVKEMNG